MAHLFAYGSLMCEDIMKEVAGVLSLKSVRADLAGYQRLEVRGEHYPGLVEKQEKVIEGVLYFVIPEESWRRLDAFEGEMYQRLQVEVRLEGGETAQAYTYAVREEHREKLAESEWSFDRFLEKGKGAFMSYYSGYDELG